MPPHAFVSAFDAATVMPAGSVSVTDRPPSDVAFAFASEIVNVLVPPGAIVVGLNALTTLGGARALALNVADAVLPVPPALELTLPVVLTSVPVCVGVTSSVIVHDAFRNSAPLLRR